MHDYTINLALFDYLPIALSALALLAISQFIYRQNRDSGQLARLGAALIISGGLLKASWKLIVAATGSHIVWMNNALFILMAPGFFLLGYALAVRNTASHTWYPPISGAVLIVAAAALFHWLYPEQRYWFFWLLAVTTLSNTAMIALLTRSAWQHSCRAAAVLFVLSFIGTLSLSGLARIPEQTAALQWLEESINSLAQLALLLASVQLYRRSSSTEDQHEQ